MRALGFEYKKAEVIKLLRENDRSGDGYIDFPEFDKLSALRRPLQPMNRAHRRRMCAQ